MLRRLLILILCLMTYGCASPQETWTQTRGGCLVDARLPHVQLLADKLASAGLEPSKVHILDSGEIGAYSWASGDVYLTAGLVDRASDDEIIAALAHEVGHLIHEYGLFSPNSLDGANMPPSLNLESRADLTALTLLHQLNVSDQALTDMLQRVVVHAPAHKAAIDARIRMIRQFTMNVSTPH